MLKTSLHPRRCPRRQAGSTLLEVLVTIVVLAFGVLGYVGMQTRMAAANVEAYGRSQAIVLLNDMVSRIDANRGSAASYLGSDYGTGTAEDCGTKIAAAVAETDPTARNAKRAAADLCEWNNALQGAAETRSSARVGAMLGARGCIEQVQDADATAGACKPAIYRVSVAWQGAHQTKTPAITCGKDAYGSNEALRRVIAERIAVGVPGSTCS